MDGVVYRLIKERFLDTPLSAEGARRYGGRWNPPGVGILYTSASPELALLEQLVHLPELPYGDLPRLFLLTLTLPDPPEQLSQLPAGWRARRPVTRPVTGCWPIGSGILMCWQ